MATKPLPDTAGEGSAGEAPRPDRKDYVPDGYASAEDFLKEGREIYKEDREANRLNDEASLDDLKFAAGDQWNEAAKALREELGQPCITIDTIPQFIAQVVGDWRVNKTAIKVLPREDSDQDIASVRADLIRNIEAQSRAERVYSKAFADQVTCGIGNFRIDLDYADDDVFDRDIFIRPIQNPLAVTWDFMSIDPTGRDAGHCFVDDMLPRRVYEKRWPNTPPSEMDRRLSRECYAQGWISRDVVRVTEYWRILTRPRQIALMDDGRVLDVTDKPEEEYAAKLYRDEAGKPRMRTVERKYAQMHLITGFAILEGPYELPINRVPIIRCYGHEVSIGDYRARSSLIRPAKDPAMQRSFIRSVITEVITKAPRNQWLAPASALESRVEDFRNAAQSGDPVLLYNDTAGAPPILQPPVPVPAALIQLEAMSAQDMKDVTGLHDASLGMRSNETSGIAIQRRQQEGDIATIEFHDNMNAAVLEGGDVVNQLIGVVYDVARTARVLGPDEEHRLVRINDPGDPDSFDLGRGKYDTAITTGPAYMTRRLEAAQSMMEAVRVAPQIMEVAGDLVAKAQDWNGADKIAERLAKALPPHLRDDENGDQAGQPTAEQAMQLQQQQAAGKMQEQAMAAEAAKQAAAVREAEAKADQAEANARRAQIEMRRAEMELAAATGRHLDSFSGVEGQPVPHEQPAPTATQTGA